MHRRQLAVVNESPKKTEASVCVICPEENWRWGANRRRKPRANEKSSLANHLLITCSSLAKFAPKKTGGGVRITEENRGECLRNLHRRKLVVVTESPKKTECLQKAPPLGHCRGQFFSRIAVWNESWRPNPRKKLSIWGQLGGG